MESVPNILCVFAVRKWEVCCSRRTAILNMLADCLKEQSFDDLPIISNVQTEPFFILQAHFRPYELRPLSHLSLLPAYLLVCLRFPNHLRSLEPDLMCHTNQLWRIYCLVCNEHEFMLNAYSYWGWYLMFINFPFSLNGATIVISRLMTKNVL